MISRVVSGPLLRFPWEGEKGKRGCSGRVQIREKEKLFYNRIAIGLLPQGLRPLIRLGVGAPAQGTGEKVGV